MVFTWENFIFAVACLFRLKTKKMHREFHQIAIFIHSIIAKNIWADLISFSY